MTLMPVATRICSHHSVGATTATAGPGQCSYGKHDQNQVERHDLGDGQQEGEAQPDRPGILTQPVGQVHLHHNLQTRLSV